MSKTISILWNEIESIEIKNNIITVSLKGKETIKIALRWEPNNELVSIKKKKLKD